MLFANLSAEGREIYKLGPEIRHSMLLGNDAVSLEVIFSCHISRTRVERKNVLVRP